MKSEETRAAARGEKVPVWDLALRLFHWLLVLAILGSYLTGEIWRSVDYRWHKLIGYTILGLLIFRVIWGFVGGRYARFAGFVKGPAAVLRYAATLGRRHPEGHAGHNPLGALSVLALLLSVAVQAVSGLFVDDGILAAGPLASVASSATRDFMLSVHATNFNVLLGLIALHLLAIAWYALWKRDRLVGAMVTGRKPGLPPEAAAPPVSPLRFLLAVAAAAGIVLLVVLGLPEWLPAPAGGGSSWD